MLQSAFYLEFCWCALVGSLVVMAEQVEMSWVDKLKKYNKKRAADKPSEISTMCVVYLAGP